MFQLLLLQNKPHKVRILDTSQWRQLISSLLYQVWELIWEYQQIANNLTAGFWYHLEENSFTSLVANITCWLDNSQPLPPNTFMWLLFVFSLCGLPRVSHCIMIEFQEQMSSENKTEVIAFYNLSQRLKCPPRFQRREEGRNV